jgi:hypothetical protein
MVNRERLRSVGLRAYELGRLRAAARAAFYLVPLAAFCALQTGAGSTCACLGALLLAVAILLRWRDRRGADSVARGLAAGSAPLALGLVMARVAPDCAHAPLFSACTAISLAVGGTAGVWIGARAAHGRDGFTGALVGAAVATLAACLGCVALGVAAMAGAAVGLLVGSAATALVVAPAR